MPILPAFRPARVLPVLLGGLALTAAIAGIKDGQPRAEAQVRAARSFGQFGQRPPDYPADPLTPQDVVFLAQRVLTFVGGEGLAVVVVDRTGAPLIAARRSQATDADVELALSLARTGAFFGTDQAPLTSRTIRFISGIHFPPGVRNQPSGDLYGIENTNRVSRQVTYNPGKEFPEPLNLAGTGPSLGITTGKADLLDSIPYPQALNPGGLPLFKDDSRGKFRQVGGVGIAGVPRASAEFAAISAGGFRPGEPVFFNGRQFGIQPEEIDPPRAIFVGGIKLPTIENRDPPPGHVYGPGHPQGPSAGAETAQIILGPLQGRDAPTGWIVGPTGAPGGELTQSEVESIILKTLKTGQKIRAAIRLPIGSRARFIIAVSDLQGNILGTYRDTDATIFSLDVAIAKARNVVYFSGPDRQPSELPGLPIGTAVNNRTINFASQPLFPSGINDSRPGPFFDLFQYDTANPGTNGLQAPNGRQNGVVFFPGSTPLYKNGVLVGGLGVSGDGVDQDDTATFYGAKGYLPKARIRADKYSLPSRTAGGAQARKVRLPYFKFVRNPFK